MVQCLGVGVGVSPIYPIKYPFPSYIGICAFLICCVGLDVAVGIGVVVCVAGIMSSSGVAVFSVAFRSVLGVGSIIEMAIKKTRKMTITAMQPVKKFFIVLYR